MQDRFGRTVETHTSNGIKSYHVIQDGAQVFSLALPVDRSEQYALERINSMPPVDWVEPTEEEVP